MVAPTRKASGIKQMVLILRILIVISECDFSVGKRKQPLRLFPRDEKARHHHLDARLLWTFSSYLSPLKMWTVGDGSHIPL